MGELLMSGTHWKGLQGESEGFMALQYRIRKNQMDEAVLHLGGRLVAGGGALQLRGLSRQLVNKYLEVDLSEVSAVDAAGLGALVFLHNQVHSCGGRFSLVNVPARVCQLLHLTGLSELLLDANLQDATLQYAN